MSRLMGGLLHTSDLQSLPLIGRGKVRDLYAVDDERLLIVQSDRISAFDVVMNEAIPGKGAVLTEMSLFWFARFGALVAHHLCDGAPESVVADDEQSQVAGRAMLVRRLKPLPIEAVCRGYLIGSGWKDYRATQSVCGIALPAGLRMAEKLPETLFTPATKAEQGEHDENISFAQMADIVGRDTALRVKTASIQLFESAADYALTKGFIIADTKFEFALDDDGELVLIDEVMTPDSSRFWPKDAWAAGQNPPSFDKQYLRDWLETEHWDKAPPPPPIPQDVIDNTAAKYAEIRNRLLS